MMQNLIVALIVVGAAVYTVRKYLPAALRQKLVYALRRRGTADSKLAGWLDTTSGCGSGCDTCRSCETPAPAGPDKGAAAGAAQEHVIKIVRRQER